MVSEARGQEQTVKAYREFTPSFAVAMRLTPNVHQVIGSIVAVLALIIVGVAVGVTVSRNNSSKSSSKLASGSSGNNTAPAGTINQTDPNDPSTFIKDPRLKHSFYGLAYTPEGSQLPQCGNTLGTPSLSCSLPV